MFTDPTQRRLINHIMWYSWMQGAALGLMLSFLAGMIWAKYTLPLASAVYLLFPLLPLSLFLAGIGWVINAKIIALRRQLQLTPPFDPVFYLIFGVLMICFSVLMFAFFYFVVPHAKA
jgi:hypothetical protein